MPGDRPRSFGKPVRHFFNFPTGLALGIIATCVLAALLDPRIGPIIEAQGVQFFTIGATLLAAGIAYAGIVRQIGHQSELEERRRQQEFEAERAVLPLALSRLSTLSRRGIQETFGIAHVPGDDIAPEGLELEATHVETIKSVIKTCEYPVRVRLQAILRGYQLCIARHCENLGAPPELTFAEQTVRGGKIISRCYSWALISSLVDSLLDFARGATTELQPDFLNERVLTAVYLAGIKPEDYEDFVEFFERAIARDRQDAVDQLVF